MARTIFDFTSLTDTALDTAADNILEKMTGNDTFPTPTPELAVLETHLQEYRTALINAALGDRQKVEVKNEKRRQLERTLRALAMYVDPIANGNVSLILSAGFSAVETGGSRLAGPRPKPIDFNVASGLHGSGEVELRVKRDRLARFYRFEYRLIGTAEWTPVQSSRSRLKLHGLEAMQLYEFRAAYLGTNPTVTYSDVVTAYAG